MATVKHWSAGNVGTAELDDSGLGDKVKTRLLATVVRMYEANRRQGTVKTKTRAEVTATTRKPYKQKGTGNARRGDFKSPLLRGGGVIFGPRPRDYSYSIPRKALREALRSALLGKLRDEEVAVMDAASFERPSTGSAAKVLADLGLEGSAAIVVPDKNDIIYKSFRNIPRVSVVRASDLNTYDVLWHRSVVMVDGAWQVLTERLAGKRVKAATEEASES